MGKAWQNKMGPKGTLSDEEWLAKKGNKEGKTAKGGTKKGAKTGLVEVDEDDEDPKDGMTKKAWQNKMGPKGTLSDEEWLAKKGNKEGKTAKGGTKKGAKTGLVE